LWDDNGPKSAEYRTAVGIAYNRLQYFVIDLDGNIRFGHNGSIAYDNGIVTDVIDELL